MKALLEKKLDPNEVDLVADVSKLNTTALIHIHSLRQLYFTAAGFPYIESLFWLRSHGIVGDILNEWIRTLFDGSYLKAAMFLRQQINNENAPRPFKARQN
jgi:hypothetical protein